MQNRWSRVWRGHIEGIPAWEGLSMRGIKGPYLRITKKTTIPPSPPWTRSNKPSSGPEYPGLLCPSEGLLTTDYQPPFNTNGFYCLHKPQPVPGYSCLLERYAGYRVMACGVLRLCQFAFPLKPLLASYKKNKIFFF
jgi:hypothetical protein